eukprot:5572023-Pyramimonas_sp.AAC.1
MIGLGRPKGPPSCARLYSCVDCRMHQRPQLFAVDALQVADAFHEVVGIDIFYALWENPQ